MQPLSCPRRSRLLKLPGRPERFFSSDVRSSLAHHPRRACAMARIFGVADFSEEVKTRPEKRGPITISRALGISEIRCESFYQRPTHNARWVNNADGIRR